LVYFATRKGLQQNCNLAAEVGGVKHPHNNVNRQLIKQEAQLSQTDRTCFVSFAKSLEVTQGHLK